MAQYDGSIRINTNISTKDARVQLSVLQHTIVKTADEIAYLRSKMDALRDQKIPTERYKELQEYITGVKDRIGRVREEIKGMEEEGRTDNDVYKDKVKFVAEMKDELKKAKVKMQELVDTGKAFTLGKDSDEYKGLSVQLGNEKKALAKMTAQYAALGGLTAIAKAQNAFGKLGEVAKKAFSKITKSVKRSSGSVSSFGSRIKGLAMSALIFNQISKAFNSMFSGMKEGFGNLYNEIGGFKDSVDGLKASMLTLKNSFAAAFRPLVEIAIPYIKKAIDALAGLMDIIGQFTAAITGQKTYTKAVKKTTAALEEAKEAEEGYLNPLDEVNKYKAKDSQSGVGGASGTMFEEDVPIKSAFLDMYENIKALIENQDWEGLGAYIAGALNRGLQKIYEVINWENVGPQITYFVTAFTGAFNGLVDNLDWDLLGRTIGAGINTMVNTLNLLITGIDWVNLGNGLASGLNGLVNKVDFTSLGMLIGNKFMILPSIALGFVQNLDWSAIGTAIGNALNGIVGSIDLSAIGTILGTGLTGIFQAAIDFAATFDWEALGTNIYQGINAFFTNTDWATVGQGISSFALGLLDAIIVAIEGTDWKAVGEGIVTMLKNIDWASLGSKLFEAGKKLINGLLEAFGELPTPVKLAIGAIEGFFAAFKAVSVISGAITAIKAIVSVLGGPLTIAIGAIIAIGALLIANWDEIKDAAGKLKDWLLDKFEAIKDGISKAVEGIKAMVTVVWNNISNVTKQIFANTAKAISDVIGGIKKVFTGLVDFVSGIFTGSWKKAWDGVTKIFSGVRDAIKGVVNGILGFVGSLANGVVNAINTVIRALNRLSFDIPSWIPLIGGNHFGFNIPELSQVPIPRLATGTVIPPNREFLAVLGDQKSGTNIEAPLDTLMQANEELLTKTLSRLGLTENMMGNNPQTIIVKLIADGKDLTDLVIRNGKVRQMSSGMKPFALT